MKDFGIVIVAGGSSTRFGRNKLLENIGDVPVFIHTILNFRHVCPDENIVFVASSDFYGLYVKIINAYVPNNHIAVAIGGDTRTKSVLNGLEKLPRHLEFVAVHDAARPMASAALLLKCLEACRIHGSGVAACQISDTIKKVDSSGFVEKTIDRTDLWAIQTPQAFRLDKLLKAYHQVINENITVTDDAGAMEHCGHKVYLVENTSPNIKITFPIDLRIIDILTKSRI